MPTTVTDAENRTNYPRVGGRNESNALGDVSGRTVAGSAANSRAECWLTVSRSSSRGQPCSSFSKSFSGSGDVSASAPSTPSRSTYRAVVMTTWWR